MLAFALLLGLGAILTLEDLFPVFVDLEFDHLNLGGVETDIDGRAIGALLGQPLDVNNPLFPVA